MQTRYTKTYHVKQYAVPAMQFQYAISAMQFQLQCSICSSSSVISVCYFSYEVSINIWSSLISQTASSQTFLIRLRDSYSTFWHTKNAETNSAWDLTKPRVGADQKGSAAPQYVHFITSAHFWVGSGSHLLTKIGGYRIWPKDYSNLAGSKRHICEVHFVVNSFRTKQLSSTIYVVGT